MDKNNEFGKNPSDVEIMKTVGESIESYLDLVKNVMIIPEEMKDEYETKMIKSIYVVEKLIKKLKKGDSSVFKYES